MYILGLATMTDSAATLMKDGVVVAAAEEERFTRVKHDGGFPYKAIEFVLEQEKIGLEQIDHVAVYWNPYNIYARGKSIVDTLFQSPSLFVEKAKRAAKVWKGAVNESSGWSSLFKVGTLLENHFGVAPRKVTFLDHHTCHMASCFYASPFEDAAILIMDGAGEAACTTWGVGEGASMRKISEHRLPHSLGHFYSAITGYLGFKMLEGEYKLMGLSPYGDPNGVDWIHENYLRMLPNGRYALNPLALDYHRALKGNFVGSLVEHFGPARPHDESAPFTEHHQNIAASAQKAFENVVLSMAKEIRKVTGMKKLGIAGGCGLNCTANGKILEAGIFEELYVPPCPHDAGGSLGAAMELYVRLTGKRPAPLRHAQLGPQYNNQYIADSLKAYPSLNFELLEEEALIQRSAEALSHGKILSWVQGRMEFGPRALGNRSFLADPRTDGIRDVINEKIKKRELFRPFAPSVKAESANQYFDIDHLSPFMTIIVPVKDPKKESIPAVTHVDGTARPQMVEEQVNQRYWKLLDRFERLTDVPVLLNTSFNIQEPIVCSPQDALSTFDRSRVDALVMGDYWITKGPEDKRVG